MIAIGEAGARLRGLREGAVLIFQAGFGRVTKVLRARIERLSADETKEFITQMGTWEKLHRLQEAKEKVQHAKEKLQLANDWLNHRSQ